MADLGKVSGRPYTRGIVYKKQREIQYSYVSKQMPKNQVLLLILFLNSGQIFYSLFLNFVAY